MTEFKITYTVEGHTNEYETLEDALPEFMEFCCCASEDHINQMPPDNFEAFSNKLPELFPNGLSFSELNKFLKEDENVKDYIDEDYYWEDDEEEY